MIPYEEPPYCVEAVGGLFQGIWWSSKEFASMMDAGAGCRNPGACGAVEVLWMVSVRIEAVECGGCILLEEAGSQYVQGEE